MSGNRVGRDERGVVAPSRVMLVAVVVLMIGAATYFATTPTGDSAAKVVSKRTAASASATSHPAKPTKSASTAPTAPTTTAPTKSSAPGFKRTDTVVEIFNNSNVKGLAGRTSAKAKSVGWNVVGSDNWYGTIPATTVYYPKRLESAAKALGRDLGISRVMPAIAPMRLDRLTVILTADYVA